MKIIETVAEMQALSTEWRCSGMKVGVVPTMGALHNGHLSLIDIIRAEVDKIILTIFVNPTQFGENEDLDKYPRTFDADVSACEEKGVDAIFFPSPEQMYSADSSIWVTEETLSQGLCAASRPTHFRGVNTVVAKLYNATLPDVAVFGEKDYQQLQILRRLTRDLNFPIKVIGGPIYREPSGLAMSSRNEYLEPELREKAAAIYKSLCEASQKVSSGEFDYHNASKYIAQSITEAGGRVDYIQIIDSETLKKLHSVADNARCLVAAYFGNARLIDNIAF